MRRLFAIVLACAPLTAVHAASLQTRCTIAGDQAVIRGSVVWSDSGQPIARARVSVMYAGSRYYAWSDGLGIWTVVAPSAGIGSVAAEGDTAMVHDPATGDLVSAHATSTSSAVCRPAVVSVGAIHPVE